MNLRNEKNTYNVKQRVTWIYRSRWNQLQERKTFWTFSWYSLLSTKHSAKMLFIWVMKSYRLDVPALRFREFLVVALASNWVNGVFGGYEQCLCDVINLTNLAEYFLQTLVLVPVFPFPFLLHWQTDEQNLLHPNAGINNDMLHFREIHSTLCIDHFDLQNTYSEWSYSAGLGDSVKPF